MPCCLLFAACCSAPGCSCCVTRSTYIYIYYSGVCTWNSSSSVWYIEVYMIPDSYQVRHQFTYSYEYYNRYVLPRGLRRGGLTPALAPRMPVMTEWKQIEAVNATEYCQGVHIKWIVFEWSEWRAKENIMKLIPGVLPVWAHKRIEYSPRILLLTLDYVPGSCFL